MKSSGINLPNPVQQGMIGASLNLYNGGYEVSLKADPETKRVWGVLAHISEADRKAILSAGFGEVTRHTIMIEERLKQLKKDRDKRDGKKK